MWGANLFDNCLICCEKYKRMVSLHEYLNECDGLSVIQVLEYLQFLKISDTANLQRTLCFICLAKIQSCYEFKTFCTQIEKLLNDQSQRIHAFYESSTVHPFSNPEFVPETTTAIDNGSTSNYDNINSEIFERISDIKKENTSEDDIPNSIETYDFKTLNESYIQKNGEEIKLEDNPLPDSNIVPSKATVTNPSPDIEIDNGIFEAKKGKKNSIQNVKIISNKSSPYDKRFICQICDKGFKRKSYLRHHSLIHAGVKPHTCNVCSKSFTYASSLATHKLIHTGHRPYVCDICNKSFTQLNSLAIHKLIHTGERPHVCGICGKTFTQAGHLGLHKLTHTGIKPFVCGICSKTFSCSRTLNRHKVIHTNEKPFACDICNLSFNQSSNLTRHKLTHTDRRPHVCDICDKSFIQTTNLAAHKLTHTGENPNVCEICNKSFTRLSSLVEHKLLHSDERMYSCDVCNKSFKLPSYLRKHKLTHVAIKNDAQ